MNEQLEAFRALVQKHQEAEFIRMGYHTQLDACVTTIKLGGKYARVDVGRSGKYMVELSTGNIYGIKAYGVIHRGHPYGSLSTINDWDWGGYHARKLAVA